MSQTEAVPATGALSLTAFAAQHQLELTRFAYLLGGDRQRAEDIVQDVLTALFRRFGDALPVSNPLAYVRAAVVNAQISHGGRRSSSERPLDRHRPEPVADPGADPVEHDATWRALARLPARQRAVLVLRFYGDLPDAEIAALIGCRVGTVSSAASRAMATLRRDRSLSPDLDEDQT